MSDWVKSVRDQELGKAHSNLDVPVATAGAAGVTTSKKDVADLGNESPLSEMLRKGLLISDQSLDIQQNNPMSPLFSVKTFQGLHLKPELLKGVYVMGFNTPSKIQETALPLLLADPPQNMIAQSQSGTGKTAAFVLTMLSRVDTSLHHPQVICLSPTYELAIQTGEVAARMGQFCPDIKIKFAVRGEEASRNTKITDHVLVGTPGKMMDWGTKLRIFDLKKVRVFVLDEADAMITMQGHHDQCIRIQKMLSPECQLLFFSATYDKKVMDFARVVVPDATVIKLTREEETLNNIKQYYVNCNDEMGKYIAIQNIYGSISIGQAIIFCQTCKTCTWLAEKMVSDGHAVAVLSSVLSIEERLKILDRFRCGQEKVLIATNVLSRGIDIEQVTIVVNFDLPTNFTDKADFETYLHRIGRTGRFGKAGIAINLIDGEHTMRVCRDIEKHFRKTIAFLNTDNSEEVEKIGN